MCVIDDDELSGGEHTAALKSSKAEVYDDALSLSVSSSSSSSSSSSTEKDRLHDYMYVKSHEPTQAPTRSLENGDNHKREYGKKTWTSKECKGWS